MATLDFTPLFRSSVGFDRIPNLLSSAMARSEEGYPPCNVEKCGEDKYRIVMALAGFSRDDLEIVVERDLSTRETEELVRRLREPRAGKPATMAPPRDSELDRVEEDLRRSLGTKVTLARSRKGGRIIIEYYSDEELGQLYDRLIGGAA